MTHAPAGWYAQADGRQRFWDGSAWTADFLPGPPRPAVPSSNPAPLASLKSVASALQRKCPPWEARIMRFGSMHAVVININSVTRGVFYVRSGQWWTQTVIVDQQNNPLPASTQSGPMGIDEANVDAVVDAVVNTSVKAYRNALAITAGDPLYFARVAAEATLPYLDARRTPEQSAEWIVSSIYRESLVQRPEWPMPQEQLRILRTPLSELGQNDRWIALEANNNGVWLIRSAVERMKAAGAPTVRVRSGLRLPTEWESHYQEIYQSNFPWFVCGVIQNAFLGNPPGGESGPWRSP